MSLDIVELWFKRAITVPHQKFNIQNSVHIEEFGEYLLQLSAEGVDKHLLLQASQAVEQLKSALRDNRLSLSILDRGEFLDSLADQIVTAVGVAYVSGMKIVDAVTEVNKSNWSKFDENGMPIFDANGKIAKNMATYKKPDLSGLY